MLTERARTIVSMPDRIEQAKRALRADLRERRQNRSESARADAALGVQTQLDALIEKLGATSLSCFLSTTTEPGTHEFVEAAVARGLRVLLPISRDDGLLDWVVATPGGAISPSRVRSSGLSCTATEPMFSSR